MDQNASVFRDQRWVSEHLRRLIGYSYPVCIDTAFGGYIAQLSDVDGHVYDGKTKHLVSTCRYIYNFSVGEALDGPTWCRPAAERGIDFLENHFRDADRDGYYWLLSGTDVEDNSKLCYGHAFVLLAYATAANAGIGNARERIAPVFDLIDEHYWEPEHDLCRIELDADWNPTSEYRGQNSNMHLCEALIEAYRVTDESIYLDRAFAIARSLVRDLADEGDGLVWEHYTTDWKIDWEYNQGNQVNRFRPWGYQTGHQLEWSKLLAILAQYREEEWLMPTAERLFEKAVEHGWDEEYGGLFYTFDREGNPLMEEKYYWKITEGIGAAALLGEWTGEDQYWEWYDRLWEYAWSHMINCRNGNWYFKLTRENEFDPTWEEDVDETTDQTPIVKTDYHGVNACRESILAATSDAYTKG